MNYFSKPNFREGSNKGLDLTKNRKGKRKTGKINMDTETDMERRDYNAPKPRTRVSSSTERTKRILI